MASGKENSYSALQSQLQSSEKHFQSRAYALSDEVQKANKAYQKTLLDVDKAYKKAEVAHAKAKQALAKKYASETKALTEKGLLDAQKKEANVKTFKERWTAQQKTIKEGFKDSLEVKKDELADIEKEKAAQEKALDNDYKKAKDKLQSIKTETTEIFLQAQEPFNNSLKYYINRLSHAAVDDQKYFKQEITALKKELAALEKKETALLKDVQSATADARNALEEKITDYSKDLTAIAAKIKATFTRATKRYDATLDDFNDVIKSGVRAVKAVEKKIEIGIASMDAKEKAFIENPDIKVDTPTLDTIVKELSQTNQLRHEAYQEMYESLFHFMDDLTGYVRTIRDDYKSTVHRLMDGHLEIYTELMDEAQLVLDVSAWFKNPDLMAEHLRISALKGPIVDHVEKVLGPFMSMQKKWHNRMLKAYKEASSIYKELDEIQAFFDAFDEEKALAFENEQVHVSKKSAQLSIEIETAKKRYEVDMLSADQDVLFEEKKRDYLVKVAGAEKRLQETRAKAEFDQKKKASQKVIDEAKAEYDLKKAYYTTEKSLLKDKERYLTAREKEAFELKRLENEKAKDNAVYAMKVRQTAELDAHEMSVTQAKNQWEQLQESKRQLERDFDQAHAAKHQDELLKLKQEKDTIELDLKRLNFDEETEIRDIEKVKDDEIMVPKNRLKEFDRALKRRYQSINKPYKALLKTFDKLALVFEDPAVSYEKVISVASNDFKDDINMTLESDYETLRWTREYYSELEVSRIKRSGISLRKQSAEIRRHEQSEKKYLESLDTYLKSTQQSVNAIFERFYQKIEKHTLLKPKELIRHAKHFHEEAIALVEEQTQSVMNEIQSLFDYIRAQDTEFIAEIEQGAASAVASIRAKYDQKRARVLADIDEINTRIDAHKHSSGGAYTESEEAELALQNEKIEAAQNAIQALENERSQKLERFKGEINALENEYQQRTDAIHFDELRRLDDLQAEMEQEAQRIQAKLEQAEQILKAIKATEHGTLDHYKQVYEYQKANAHRAYEDRVRDLEDAIAEAKREQDRKKIEIERVLNRNIDTIQKEISSKETQLEAALEKVNREYDTLYFDKQTRTQHLNERVEVIRKKLIQSKQELLDELKAELSQMPELTDRLAVKAHAQNDEAALRAHRDEITRWIEEKKRTFQESL